LRVPPAACVPEWPIVRNTGKFLVQSSPPRDHRRAFFAAQSGSKLPGVKAAASRRTPKWVARRGYRSYMTHRTYMTYGRYLHPEVKSCGVRQLAAALCSSGLPLGGCGDWERERPRELPSNQVRTGGSLRPRGRSRSRCPCLRRGKLIPTRCAYIASTGRSAYATLGLNHVAGVAIRAAGPDVGPGGIMRRPLAARLPCRG
jgi:hypothetical protein